MKVVVKLKCRLCSIINDKIVGRKNFSDKWINGAESVRSTNIVDHANSDQHTHAMNLQKKELAQARGLGVASYALIAQPLNSLLDDE